MIRSFSRDPHFNLNDFLRALKSECRTWRRVFWRLWGVVHPLSCSLCHSYFPTHLYAFCAFHPQDADFPSLRFKNSTEPFGRFPCCEAQLFRFSTMSTAEAPGCQARDHRVKLRRDLVRFFIAYSACGCYHCLEANSHYRHNRTVPFTTYSWLTGTPFVSARPESPGSRYLRT